jgi:tetratricopeptide (TPR) repeat protein/TolB-like protein
VAVAAFNNETGDSTLAPLGRMAGDWITQGLQQTGLASVVPWPTALQASDVADAARTSGQPVELVSHMQSETGADVVVTGSVYRVGDRLVFRAEVTDAERGEVLSAPNPIAVPPDSAEAAIRVLRDRLMTSLAISNEESPTSNAVLNRNLPTFEAYRAYDRGLELANRQEYRRAVPEFLRAYELDTTFTATLLHAAATLNSMGEFARVDSLVEFLSVRRDRFGEYEDVRFQYLQAVIESDNERALLALKRSAELAPESKSAYSGAVIALRLNRPHLAYTTLSGLDPDRGSLRGWAAYWTYLTHASHLVGDHEGELAAAREMRIRHPERRIALVLEARALAVLGRTDELDRVLAETGAMAPNTYWSQGAALVVAGEELVAHGDDELGRAYLGRAIEWLENELVAEPDLREHLYWLGSAYYDLGRWSEAQSSFDALAARYPNRPSYGQMAALAAAHAGDRDAALEHLGDPGLYELGTNTAYRARLEAISGDPEVAISLLSEALGQGVDGWSWLHATAHADWAQLEGNPRFQRLMRGDAAARGSGGS